MRGTTLGKKKKQLPGEDHAPARMVFVDPRRTVTVNSAEAEAGKENKQKYQMGKKRNLFKSV